MNLIFVRTALIQVTATSMVALTKKRKKNLILPKTVKIGPFTFKVIRHEYLKDERNNLGYFRAAEHEISIADDVPDELQSEVLLHELLHGCWYRSQLAQNEDVNKLEEQVIATLSLSMLEMFQKNPKLKDVFF